MSSSEWKTLRNAAASSQMENLPYEQRHFETIREILDGKRTLQDYLLIAIPKRPCWSTSLASAPRKRWTTLNE